MRFNFKKYKNLVVIFLIIGALVMAGRQIQLIDLFNKTFFSKNKLTKETFLSGFLTASVLSNKSSENGTNKNIQSEVIISCPFDVLEIPVPDKVVINEVAWMGTAENFNNEWIELKNISTSTVSISGWQLIDKDEQIKIIFPDSAEIPANEFYLLEKGEKAVSGVEADIIYSGNLRNSEESLKLFNDKCGLIDEVSANPNWPAGNNRNKNSMERDLKNFSWYTSSIISGTPGNINSDNKELVEVITPKQKLSRSYTFTESQVLISEIMAGVDGNARHEFVELYNPTSHPVDLSGWTLKKKSSTGSESSLVISSRLEGKIIMPGDYFLLANGGGWTDNMTPDVKWPSSYTLAYANNSISIYNSDGEVVDEINWQEIPKGNSFERFSWEDDKFIIQISPNPQGSN